MVINIKGKLMVCLIVCLTLYIPLSYATSQSWSYRIDGISTAAMTSNGQNIIVGSSSGVYYLFNEFGDLISQENLGSEIRSVDIGRENIVLGTKTATFIFNVSGQKIAQFLSGPIFSVAISENDSCAISGSDDNVFIFPSLESGMQLYVGTSVNHVSISSTGKEAAAVTSEKVFFFNIDESITSWEYQIPSINSMQLSQDGKFLTVGTKQGTLYLLGKTKELLFKKDLVGSVNSVGVNDNIVIAGTSIGRIYLFNTAGIEITNFLVDRMVDCDISQNGRFIVAASLQKLFMYTERGEILWQKDINNIKSVEISADGEYVVAATDSSILFFRNWEEPSNGTRYFPYPSRGLYSFESFRKIREYSTSPILVPYILQPCKRVAVEDVNGDGDNEIVASTGTSLVVFDSKMNVLFQKSYESDVLHIALLDLDNDTVPEIACSLSDGQYRIFVLGFRKGELQELGEFDLADYFGVSQKERMEAAIVPVFSYDIDDDQKIEIIALANSGYTLKPRGVVAFEYPSGVVKWFYKSAPSAVIDAIYDIDRDGKPEIILGSHGCCNGNTEGQRDDCHAYVVVLNLSGTEVWSKEVAEGLKTVRVGVEDVNGDGEVEIVGTINDAQNIRGGLFVMDDMGDLLYDRELSSVFYLGGIGDLDRDGYKEIVVTDAEGKISIYNFRLELEKTHNVTAYQLSQVEGINDIDGDGGLEIVVRTWDGHAIILDSNLEEEWNRAFEHIYNILMTNVSGCGNDLLILTRKSLEFFSFESEEEYLCAKFIPGSSGTPETTSPPTETPETTSPPTDELETTSPPTETPETTSPPTEEPESSPPADYDWPLIILIMILAIISLLILRKSVRRHEIQDLMILSLEKRDETKYQIALESVRGTIYPVRSARTIDISLKVRSEIIARIEYTSKVITNYLNPERRKPLQKPTEELKKMGTIIYKHFIPRDFAQKLVHHYIVLETEDNQIPWELMYSDQFFALKYAISRRIKSEKAPEIHNPRKRGKKALIIADPTETLPEAITECEYLKGTLQDYFAVTYLTPREARKVDVMYHLSQGYDIVHYAGELKEDHCLPVYKDVLTCEEIEKTLEGSPIVFLNGCGSAKTFSYNVEGLAEVFLQRGALSFIGSLWSIHDKTAAEIAAEFYRNCLDHPVGESLRLSREKYYSSEDITWAAFVMYGDPTLNLFR